MSIYKLYISLNSNRRREDLMMKRLLVLLIVPAVFIAACGAPDKSENKAVKETSDESPEQAQNVKTDPKPKRDSKVVARVNGVPIYQNELKGRPLQYLITEEVIYQKGLGLGLDEKYAQKLRDYKKQLVVHELKMDILENLPPTKEVSDEEIKSYYDNNPDRYTFVRMHEVGFVDKNLGDEILEKMKSGEDLTEIVNAYLESGANVVGRDLGYNREMVKEFDAVELGSVTDVITKPDGSLSVIKIVEIKPIPLHQTERPIRRILEAKRKGYANDNYANQIIQESGIEVEIIEN